MANLNAPKFLLVDDEPHLRQFMASTLKTAGYTIAGEAEDGVDAIEKFLELKPDVVLMDLDMPRKSGYEALREIRKHEPGVIAFMLSASKQMSDISDCLKEGAASFLSKTDAAKAIIANIERLIFCEKQKLREAQSP